MNLEQFQSSDAVPEASHPSESALVLETGNGKIEPLECPPDEAEFPVETTHTLFVHLSLHYLHAEDRNPHAKLYRHGDMLVPPTNTPLVVRWERDENCLRVQLSATLLKQVAAEILGKANNRLMLVPTFQSCQQQLAAISTLLMAEAQQRQPSSKLYLDSLANVLAVQLLRNVHNYVETPAQLPSYEGGLPTSQLNQILDYIDAGVARTIHLGPINVKVMRNAP